MTTSSIPEEVAASILVKCGRCCCLCRRFKPIRLQVHHIEERAKGGTDEPDNLIALCLTCHTDVHTKTQFTRRFTATELKQHRDAVFNLVAAGKLVPKEEADSSVDVLLRAIIETLAGHQSGTTAQISTLDGAAVKILISATTAEPVMCGMVQVVRFNGGMALLAAGKPLNGGEDSRENAFYRAGLRQLLETGLIETTDARDECYEVSHEGYLVADQILAAGAQNDGGESVGP